MKMKNFTGIFLNFFLTVLAIATCKLKINTNIRLKLLLKY